MPEEPRGLIVQETDIEGPDLSELLPPPSLHSLTADEAKKQQQLQAAFVIIGQAASGALICPGNQEGLAETAKCPYSAKCELLKIHKAPEGELCPIEREILLARFYSWCATIQANPKNLKEDQRAFVSEITWIDIQEQRCASILSKGEASRLTQINVKDSNPETNEWISWERVIHANAEMLDSLHTRRRMLLREWMLTPEQKFKAAKALGKLGAGQDLSKRQSALADKLRDLDAIDAEFTEVPEKL